MEVEFDIATDGIASGARRLRDSIDLGILRTLYGVPSNLTRLRCRRPASALLPAPVAGSRGPGPSLGAEPSRHERSEPHSRSSNRRHRGLLEWLDSGKLDAAIVLRHGEN